MSSYHCYATDGSYRLGEFPGRAIGVVEFHVLLRRLSELPTTEDLEADYGELLVPLRALHLRRNLEQTLRCPRVFISHRQLDRQPALRIAYLATDEKFDYWLDILDPKIAAAGLPHLRTAYQQAILIAAIVEMALLNCTHVLAVMTKNVPGTMWMPYEYGRVKDSALTSVRVAGWFDGSWNVSNMPEYFHLGQKLYDEAAIRRWFGAQFSAWGRRTGSRGVCPTKDWQLVEPPELPV